MDGYLVQQPFADLIASGQKVWDVRTQPVHLSPRRRFYILATMHPHPIAKDYPQVRLGCAVATAVCAQILGPMDISTTVTQFEKHRIDPDILAAYARGRALYAMVLADVQAMDPPASYRPRPGAVHIITNVQV